MNERSYPKKCLTVMEASVPQVEEHVSYDGLQYPQDYSMLWKILRTTRVGPSSQNSSRQQYRHFQQGLPQILSSPPKGTRKRDRIRATSWRGTFRNQRGKNKSKGRLSKVRQHRFRFSLPQSLDHLTNNIHCSQMIFLVCVTSNLKVIALHVEGLLKNHPKGLYSHCSKIKLENLRLNIYGHGFLAMSTYNNLTLKLVALKKSSNSRVSINKDSSKYYLSHVSYQSPK